MRFWVPVILLRNPEITFLVAMTTPLQPTTLPTKRRLSTLFFLFGETHVVEALRRAGDLFQQRHGLNGTTHLAPTLSDWDGFRAMHGSVPPSFPSLESESSSTFAALPVPSKATIRGYVDASYALPGNGVHTKFVSGNESASVLLITKRPKLRQSLGPNNVSDMSQARSSAEQSSSADGYPVPANLHRDSFPPSNSLDMMQQLLHLPNFF
jgi:hypothetical protein